MVTASRFALGLGYNYLNGAKVGTEDQYGYSNTAKIHTNIAELYGRFAYPLDNVGSDIFFKVGPTYNRTSCLGSNSSKGSFVAGLGGQWALTKNIALRAGYDYFYNTYNKDGDKLKNVKSQSKYILVHICLPCKTPLNLVHKPAIYLYLYLYLQESLSW